jgi:hypothetical protein
MVTSERSRSKPFSGFCGKDGENFSFREINVDFLQGFVTLAFSS